MSDLIKDDVPGRGVRLVVSDVLAGDPDNVPVRIINGSYISIVGSIVDLTLNTLRITFDAEGKAQNDRIIAARLRFDLEMAKIIRDQLNVQIAALSVPSDAKAN